MSEGYFHRLHQETPTRLWINNPTLEEADLAIAAGAISCTTNPAYSARIVKMKFPLIRCHTKWQASCSPRRLAPAPEMV